MSIGNVQFQGIQVGGTGKVSVTPDQAHISLGVQSEAKQAAQALATNSKKMQEVFKSLQGAGVELKDMQTSQLSVSPMWSYPKNKKPVLTGYSVSNNLSVKVRNLDDFGKLLDAAVQSGANQVNRISFEATKSGEAEQQALKLAMADAKAKAQLIATADGVKLGTLISLVEDVQYPQMPINRQMARAESFGDSAPPVAAGELELIVTVTAVYAFSA